MGAFALRRNHGLNLFHRSSLEVALRRFAGSLGLSVDLLVQVLEEGEHLNPLIALFWGFSFEFKETIVVLKLEAIYRTIVQVC